MQRSRPRPLSREDAELRRRLVRVQVFPNVSRLVLVPDDVPGGPYPPLVKHTSSFSCAQHSRVRLLG